MCYVSNLYRKIILLYDEDDEPIPLHQFTLKIKITVCATGCPTLKETR